MTDLCREFGISRKTGYKIWERFKRQGVTALADESRAPKRVARKTSAAMEQLLVGRPRGAPIMGRQEAQGRARA
jgi:hypothetical protein